MFECPLCQMQYGDPRSADWCRSECEQADREARRR